MKTAVALFYVEPHPQSAGRCAGGGPPRRGLRPARRDLLQDSSGPVALGRLDHRAAARDLRRGRGRGRTAPDGVPHSDPGARPAHERDRGCRLGREPRRPHGRRAGPGRRGDLSRDRGRSRDDLRARPPRPAQRIGGRRPPDRGADRQALRHRRGSAAGRLPLGRAGRVRGLQRLQALQASGGTPRRGGADPLGRGGPGSAHGGQQAGGGGLRRDRDRAAHATRRPGRGRTRAERHARAARDREHLRGGGAHGRDRLARQLHVGALPERHGAVREGRAEPRLRRGGARRDLARGAPARRRQDRRAGRHPDEAGSTRPSRVGDHEVLSAVGCRDDRAVPEARQRRLDRAVPPRALERRRLSRRAERRGDPACKPSRAGLRCLRRDDARPPVAIGLRALGRRAADAQRRRASVRPRGHRRAHGRASRAADLDPVLGTHHATRPPAALTVPVRAA